MSFTLIDQGSENFELNASVWQWKAAVELIRSYDILSEGTLRQMEYNATGVKVSVDDAREIANKITDITLPKMGVGKRIFADLSITDAPDDMTLHRDSDEQWKNYSVTHEWLEEFVEFCQNSKGFQVF
ncbi:MAG TPA: hypothetical protein PKA82_07620 [Pyrinomonadaceae bacterium]|nr:hypothetical protein [Pyrinomonadaceae bacterium]